VGSFPAYGRWAEWNGKYRDAVRRFLKGDPGMVGELAHRIQGSPDLYGNRGPATSINFITAHDGFTLADLFAYNEKHNAANGEDNRDGANDNHSWNCGWEGPTDDPDINNLRQRQIRNAIAILMTSQGVPMILMGDEMGRTQHGNNNAYCHDAPLSWVDWSDLESNADVFRFVQRCIALRQAHPILRGASFLRNEDYRGVGQSDISWHGVRAGQPDWSDTSRTLAFMLSGQYAPADGPDADLYVAMNMHWDGLPFELPAPAPDRRWHVVANTAMPAPEDVWEDGSEPPVEAFEFLVGPRSVVILASKPA
jgi:isoamylase